MERRFDFELRVIISGFQIRACLRDIRCKIEANEALNITWLWTVKVAILIGVYPPKVVSLQIRFISKHSTHPLLLLLLLLLLVVLTEEMNN